MQRFPLNLMGASASYVSNSKMPGTFKEHESGSIHLSGRVLTIALRTLAAFAVTTLDEVDLNCLQTQRESIIQETVQPAQVSLWLHPCNLARKTGTLVEGGN